MSPPKLYKAKSGYILNQDKTMVFTRFGWETVDADHLVDTDMKEILVQDYLGYIEESFFLSVYATKLKAECIRLLKEYTIHKAINDL